MLGSKIDKNLIEIEAHIKHRFFYRIFWFLEASGVTFGGHFGVILVCFLAAQPRRGQNRENHEQ